MDQIISTWKTNFRPIQHEVETGIDPIAGGKAVRQPMEGDNPTRGSNYVRPSRNGISSRQSSFQLPAPPTAEATTEEHSSISSQVLVIPRSRATSVSPSLSSNLSQSDQRGQVLTVAGKNGTSLEAEGTSTPSATRPGALLHSRSQSSSSVLSAVAAKKKPPPPPPPKRGHGLGVWVTALYSFEGQNAGDLAFKEGDKIRVLKRTDRMDDWWEGELRGNKGSFPANYCQVG